MKYVQAKPSRLHCSTCDETYSLPQNGNIKLYKELRCPLDDFELILWTTGARGKVNTEIICIVLGSNFINMILIVTRFYVRFMNMNYYL